MRNFLNGLLLDLRSDNRGMELVQVAILIAIAVVIGLIFNKQITSFVNGVFKDLFRAGF
ncbi:MAG: hypothetical protein K6A91_07200 [Clostridia bacterium]|nr:hypothetical protein [Bacillota bacterium]MBR3302283.1 hypothetical protein [Bacillota bacterium]MBR6237077.1 hypothetical protein [Bacillota bacterium]MCR5010706.1 hypothetical protein [Clostridia bacterium]